jgi:predicted NAD/FAD-binding protein
LEGNLRRMLDRAPGTQVHVNAGAQALSYENGKWSVTTAAGVESGFDYVIMNAPPHTSKNLLQPMQWASDVVSLLGKYEYFDARVVIHTDPKYVHKDRNFWAVYNGGIDGAECEGSVWYGGIHGKLPSGATVNIFKSWAHHRRADPTNILFERRFRHPLITPEVVRATRSLQAFQGRNGLYFSGQHTTGMDLQESAVYSAMKVAKAIAPNSANLASLNARLALRNRTGISYDL